MQPCELRKARSIWLMSIYGSARITLCTTRADKCAVGRHEPCKHRWHKLGRLNFLAMFLRKHLGVGNEIAMHGTRQFDGELDRPVVGHGRKRSEERRVGKECR